MRSVSLGFLLAVAGCGSGCDGERLRPPDAPRTPGVQGPDAPAATDDAGAPSATGYLDAQPGTLDALFTALAAAERQDPSGRALLVFFGDSHTAGDAMTSRLRVTLQRRFGDAGRGLVAAGRPPARHYYQRDVRYGASGPWKSAVGGTRDAEPYGVVGLRVHGERKGAQLWVETCADCQAGTSVAQFEILYHAAPDRGLLRYRVDAGPWQQLPTKTQAIEPPHPARHVIPVTDGPHKLTLEHGGGGTIDLFGIAMERLRPGVVVDSLGIVGRRLAQLRSWDWSIIGEQLATRDPRLVVLQYGTNEADDPEIDLDAIARHYDETILRIRAAAPSASILILGPPDMGVREAGKACDRMKPPKKQAEPDLASPGVAGARSTPTGSAQSIDAGVIPECEWRTPSILRDIISVQHAAAARNKVAFFDSFAALGGSDRMHEWVTAEPALAYKDHVHLTALGYQRWADELSTALLADYDRWKKTQAAPTPPAPTLAPAGEGGG